MSDDPYFASPKPADLTISYEGDIFIGVALGIVLFILFMLFVVQSIVGGS